MTKQAYHPIVDDVLAALHATNKNSLEGLLLTEEGAEQLKEKLQALSGDMEQFRAAVRDLVSFANHLHDVKSPDAADVIMEVIASNPIVAQLAANASKEEMVEQREKLGDKFAKFATTASPSETSIETDEPSISAVTLLKGRFNG